MEKSNLQRLLENTKKTLADVVKTKDSININNIKTKVEDSIGPRNEERKVF